MLAHDIQPQGAGALQKRGCRRAAVQQLVHEVLAQGDLQLIAVVAVGQHVAGLAFLDLPGHVLDGAGQLLGAHGLEQVLVHAQGDGLLGVLKIVVPADDHNLEPGHHLARMADELEPVQKRHADIRQHEIGHEVLHHGKRHLPVRHLPAEGVRPGHMLDDSANALTDEQLILHHKDLIHAAFPPSDVCFHYKSILRE